MPEIPLWFNPLVLLLNFNSDGTRFDCGSRLGFIEANIAFSLQDPEIGAQVAEFISRYAVQEIAPKAQKKM